MDTLFKSNTNLENKDSILYFYNRYLNETYEYNQDFITFLNGDTTTFNYLNLLADSVSIDSIHNYIINNCNLLNFENEYINNIIHLINSKNDYLTKIENLEDLEDEILNYETDSIENKYRLLSCISVAQNSIKFWNEHNNCKEAPGGNILLADALGVYASGGQIAYGFFFGPWTGLGYMAFAAATASTIAYISSK